MKSLFTFLLFLLCLNLIAQIEDSLFVPDSLFNYREIAYYEIPIVSCIKLVEPIIINNDSTYKNIFYSDYVQKYCSEYIPFKINFSNNSLLCISNFADCNAKFKFKIFFNESKKEIIILLYQYYGGCRGMNFFNNAFLVEKIQPECKLKIEEIIIDEKY